MTRVRDLTKLTTLITHVISRTVPLQHASLFLWEPEAKCYMLLSSHGPHRLAIQSRYGLQADDPLIQQLIEQQDLKGEISAELAELIDAGPLKIVQSTWPEGQVNQSFRVAIETTGRHTGAYSFIVGTTKLPAGLTLIGNTIEGTPQEEFDEAIWIQAIESWGTIINDMRFELVIKPAAATTKHLDEPATSGAGALARPNISRNLGLICFWFGALVVAMLASNLLAGVIQMVGRRYNPIFILTMALGIPLILMVIWTIVHLRNEHKNV